MVEVNEKVEGKEEDLQRVITVQQQRINELEQKLVRFQQEQQDYKANMQQLHAELEQAQLQIR